MEKENNLQTFMIRDPEAIFEAAFQACWDRLPDGVILNTSGGFPVRILSRGEWNHEAGPDFLNAKIEMHGNIIRGNIELHRKSSDYIRHGHLSDAAYDNVILHVVAEDDLAGKKAESALAHIPLCRLSPSSLERRAQESPCRCRIFPYMHEGQLKDFFAAAGQERLQIKAAGVLETMIRQGTAYAFREVLFRAAGFKRNQDGFKTLFERVEAHSPADLQSHYPELLWGESGLLPDPAATPLPEDSLEIVQTLWENYWSLRLRDEPHPDWKHDSVRPLNTPERRIAMIAAFLDCFGMDPLPDFADRLRRTEPEKLVIQLRLDFKLTDPFWERHNTFVSKRSEKSAQLLGSERAETLLIDVIVPSLLAFAKLKNEPELERRALQMFRYLAPQMNNRVCKNALRRWFPETADTAGIFDNAEKSQGCLHIYKRYCANTAGDCVSCLLANS